MIDELFLIHHSPQTQWTGNDDVRVVELRVVFDGFSCDFQSQPEHVIVVAAKQGLEIVWLIFPRGIDGFCVFFKESLLVFLLLRLIQLGNVLDKPSARLARWKNDKDLGSRESLIS